MDSEHRQDPQRHTYEVRPRKDKRADLISDALPYGALLVCRAEPVNDAIN